MNVKKISPKELEGWDLSYLEGEVTSEDITVERVTEDTERYESEVVGVRNTVTSKVTISLDPEIVEILGWNDKHHGRYADPGICRLVRHDTCRSDKESQIKSMMTKHRKACDVELSEEKVHKQIQFLVDSANRDIVRSREKFCYAMSQTMRNVDEWTFDSQAEIDRIQREIDELQDLISVKSKAKRKIIGKEMGDWLDGVVKDGDMRKEIMDGTGYGDRKIPSRKKYIRKT